MKKYSLIFLCMFLPCILYAEEASAVISDVKILLDEGTWVPKHSLDVLESKNRDYMSNFVPDIESFTFDETEILRLEGILDFDSDDAPDIFFWHEVYVLEPIKIDKYPSYGDVLYIASDINLLHILDATYVGDMVKFTVNVINTAPTMLDLSKLTKNETVDMFFLFDGDYLHIYISEVVPENLFYTFACINDATVNEFKRLMRYNICDLFNVTWPLYANGTSDYNTSDNTITTDVTDNRIIFKSIVENHEVGKTYLTTDKLRVRQEQGLTGTPLFTLPKDTRVRLLKLGNNETIDTITANWLQVEVVEDTIDTEGTEVKKGTIGWCFGGYVTRSPEIVVDEAKEIVAELENTDENATTQTIPWILGGGIVLLLGAIGTVIIVRKKKKSK